MFFILLYVTNLFYNKCCIITLFIILYPKKLQYIVLDLMTILYKHYTALYRIASYFIIHRCFNVSVIIIGYVWRMERFLDD